MTLSKLAIKNLKTQFRYYLMYFVSMTFSVMVYYSFVSMSFDKELIKRASDDMRIDAGLRTGSVMIILFIIIFMFSANTFFVKRRKREIGLYSLLGMRRRQIGSLFFVENMLLGIFALVVGVLLGIIFSKLFAMVLLKFMQVPVASHFIFSLPAIKNTVIIFLIILGIVSIRTATTVYRFKLITLFQAEQQGDKSVSIKWYNYLFGSLGLVLLVTGYFLAHRFYDFGVWLDPQLSGQGLFILVGPFFILFLCVLGTYLFFGHFLGIILKIVSKNKKHYYRDINMVTTGNLSFNLKKNSRTFATIAVLLGTALAAIGGAASVQSYTLSLADSNQPASYSVSEDYYLKLKEFLAREDVPILDEAILKFKYVGGEFAHEDSYGKSDGIGLYNVISLSNYNQIRKMIKTVPEIQLSDETDVAIIGGVNQVYLDQAVTYEQTGILANIGSVTVVTAVADLLGNVRDMRLSYNGLVVTDILYEKIKAQYQYEYHLLNVENGDKNSELAQKSESVFREEADKRQAIIAQTTKENNQMVDSIEELPEALVDNIPEGYTSRGAFSIRYPYYSNLVKSTGLLIYVAVFLGMVFMIATGSIISLKQLSEAEDEKNKYDLLRKLGTPKELIKKNVYKQNMIVFFVPLFISLAHAYFAIRVLFALIGKPDVTLTYISITFLMIIYIIFYFITSSAYHKVVSR